MDEAVLELRQQNEWLKKQLFWRTHGKSAVKNSLHHMNMNITECGCVSCQANRFAKEDDDFEEYDFCKLQQEFEELLDIFGFIVVRNGIEDRDDSEETQKQLKMMMSIPEDCDPSTYHHRNIGADFCLWSDEFHLPTEWSFGRKLWSCNVNSPRLKAYHEMLNGMNMDGPEYSLWKRQLIQKNMTEEWRTENGYADEVDKYLTENGFL